MTLYRVLSVVAILATIPLQAGAQFGGMPGLPGGSGPSGGFGGPPSGRPPACQQLLSLRDETHKSASAINVASERKAEPAEACKLFRTFLATETKMIKAVEEVGPQCGVPPEVPKKLKAGHAKAQQIAKQVCDFAARGGRPRPNWDDLIGIRPTVADAQGERFRDWPHKYGLPLEP